MKGLLLKDYYTLFKQAKLFIFIIVIFAVFPGYSMSVFAVVYAGILPITALAYDERAKWGSLAAMMPYSVRNIVLSKYLLGYIGLGAAAVVSLVATYVIGAVRHTPAGPEDALSLLLIASVSAIILGVNLPAMFRFGVEKGRIFFLILLAAVVAAGVIFWGDSDAFLFSADVNLGAIAVVAAVIAVLLNIFSISLSARLYRRRQG